MLDGHSASDQGSRCDKSPAIVIWGLIGVISTALNMFPASHAASDFESWKQQHEEAVQQNKDAFADYKAELQQAFRAYHRKTAAIWGRKNIDPNAKNWISYIDRLNQRSVVDLEKGTVEVDIALPAEQKISDSEAQKQLQKVLLKAMAQHADRRPMQQLAEQPVSQPENKPDSQPVLQGQISNPEGNAARPEDYRKIARDAARVAERKIVRGDDGKTRIVYSTTLRLVPEHIRIRAQKYQPLVERYAAQHQVPVAVVFAVIETESMFNPTARSGAPAFGLMQLVPSSGARDAYRYLYNKDRVVSDTYLYDPENNIRLGTAYLARLNKEYLAGIDSDQSRMLASIAAYNTGSGNVLRAFAGKYQRARFGSYKKYQQAAFREVNRRSPQQVYQHLRSHLPYHETRDYIKKVRARMNKYSADQAGSGLWLANVRYAHRRIDNVKY